MNNKIEKKHIKIVFQAQWNASISLVIIKYWWHILNIHFQLFRAPLKPLFFVGVLFGLSLPLDEVLSISSFGPGFEVMFWLELCVGLLLQKSD